MDSGRCSNLQLLLTRLGRLANHLPQETRQAGFGSGLSLELLWISQGVTANRSKRLTVSTSGHCLRKSQRCKEVLTRNAPQAKTIFHSAGINLGKMGNQLTHAQRPIMFLMFGLRCCFPAENALLVFLVNPTVGAKNDQ
jgi:hypothetical protein